MVFEHGLDAGWGVLQSPLQLTEEPTLAESFRKMPLREYLVHRQYRHPEQLQLPLQRLPRGQRRGLSDPAVYIERSALEISGTPKVFTHAADSGSVMEKHFCPDCGSQMFGHNRSRPDRISIRAGVLDQSELVKPAANLYLSSKIESTPIDPDLEGYSGMPD